MMFEQDFRDKSAVRAGRAQEITNKTLGWMNVVRVVCQCQSTPPDGRQISHLISRLSALSIRQIPHPGSINRSVRWGVFTHARYPFNKVVFPLSPLPELDIRLVSYFVHVVEITYVFRDYRPRLDRWRHSQLIKRDIYFSNCRAGGDIHLGVSLDARSY